MQRWAVVDGVQTVPDVHNSLPNLSPTKLKYKGKTLNNNIFETRADFFSFCGMQVQLDEGGGKILLGDNTRGGAYRLQP